MMKKFKKILIFIFLLASFYFAVDFSLAQSLNLGTSYVENTGLEKDKDVRVVLVNIIRIALTFLGVIATIIIMYGGWMWMTSNGDSQKVDTAKKTLVSAVIGLIIILSSFLIVTWVMNQMSGTVLNPNNGVDPDDPNNNIPPNSNGSFFYAKKLAPKGDNVAVNSLIEVTFNSFVDPLSVDNGTFHVRNKSTGDVVDGVLSVFGNKIKFEPSGECPVNSCNVEDKCFDKHLNVEVQIDAEEFGGGSGVFSSGGVSLTCNLTHPCSFEFTTGDYVSCAGSACAIDLETDCSVAGLNCHANDSKCSTNYCDCSGTLDECAAAGYGDGVENCCLCQNVPEIAWISPVGGFCAGDSNTPCHQNTAYEDCGNFENKTCDIDTPNAAVGNMITIGGSYFGNTPGLVSIGGIAANLANAINSTCINSWTNEQIIVIVPDGLNIGLAEVEVKAANNYIDTNKNDRGPNFDFLINTIDRPGICALMPDNAISGVEITYHGINLENESVANFGNIDKYVPALFSNFPSDSKNQKGVAQVPYIKKGKTTTFVKNIKKINSNYLFFEKLPDADSDPYISSFEPKAGSAGQYVTIYGKSFDNPAFHEIGEDGDYHIYFDMDYDLTTTDDQLEAAYDFPVVCQDNIWEDEKIIVKVPDLATIQDNQNYYIVIDIDGTVINSSKIIDPTFNFNSSLALLPSLCKIRPNKGKIGDEINLWGEYFLSKNSSSKVIFNREQEQDVFSFWDKDSENNADKITTTVVLSAISGDVRVSNEKGSGNGLNFEIGECTIDSECGAGNFCCPQGTQKQGSCVPSLDSCYANIDSSVYEWSFNTGISTSTDKTEPFDNSDGPQVEYIKPDDGDNAVCRNVKIQASFDKLMDLGSLEENILLIGDYEDQVCPDNTRFITAYNHTKDNNIFVRIKNKIVKNLANFLPPKLFAYTETDVTHNYCLMNGFASGYHNIHAKDGAGTSTAEYTISSLLDANTVYYLLIKGDSDYNDNVLEGVLSKEKAVLNNAGTFANNPIFNGVEYKNSFVWSFRTMNDDSKNNGVCLANQVKIKPASYLFKSTTNDFKDDDITNSDFDTKKNDSDKFFQSNLLDENGNLLSSIENFYSWEWTWETENDKLVDIKDVGLELQGNNQVFEAISTAIAGDTNINASAIITSPAIEGGSAIKIGKAFVAVFFCDNPWPEVDANGEWRPWSDTNSNCTAGNGSSCFDMAYSIYYCRDEGKNGTFDDLPSFKNTVTVFKDVDIDENADLNKSLLKQIYYLREDRPDTEPEDFDIAVVDTGTELNLSWKSFENASEYKIYYGQGSENYKNSTSTKNTTIKISDLENDIKYCFVVTAIINGEETNFSEEKCAIPVDEQGPEIPILDDPIKIDETSVKLIWNDVLEVESYIVYWGLGIHTGFAQKSNVGLDTVVIIDNLETEKEYKFQIKAIDEYENESFSEEKRYIIKKDDDIL